MTKKIFLLVSLATLLCGSIQAQQVEWKTIEQAAKTDTKSNAKLYFVDFYTSWCGWCKKMDRETFSNPVVAKILNTYYIPVKFDAEGSSEFTWKGNKYSGATTAPGSRRGTHSFAKAVLGTQMGFPSFGLQPIQAHHHPRLPIGRRLHCCIVVLCLGRLQSLRLREIPEDIRQGNPSVYECQTWTLTQTFTNNHLYHGTIQ